MKSKEKTLTFTCPKCGKHVLEQVLTDCQASTKIEGVTEDEVSYNQHSDLEDGDTRFQCDSCGWVIQGVSDDDGLIEWLNENQV